MGVSEISVSAGVYVREYVREYVQVCKDEKILIIVNQKKKEEKKKRGRDE